MIPFADTMIRGREPAKGKDGIIQLLDYNLERFEFEDKKGKSSQLEMLRMSRRSSAWGRPCRLVSGLEIAMYTSSVAPLVIVTELYRPLIMTL